MRKKERGKKKCFCAVLVVLLMASLGFNGSLVQAQGDTSQEVQEDVTTAADQACNGVVRVFSSFGGMASTGSGFGVGTVGKETDIFITNWHVVADEQTGKISDEVYILLDNEAVKVDPASGAYIPDYSRMVKCEVLRTTEGYPDFAILRAENTVKGRTALPLLPSRQAKRGENVFALGFPGSSDMANGKTYCAAQIEDVTVTTGTLSRFTELKIAGDTMVIQHDAHINHGNSGGPLITEEGAVIGINTYYFGASDEETKVENEHSAAVFIDYAIEALDDLDIYYEIWGEGQPDADAGADTETGSDVDPKPQRAAVLWAVIGGCAGVAVLCIVALLVGKKKKTSAVNPREPKGEPPELRHDSGNPVPRPAQADPGAFSRRADSGMRLQAVSGVFAGKRYAINNKVRIGRDASRNELVYPQGTPGISSVHCEVIFQNGQVYIRDVGSTYGTFVGGKRIEPNRQILIKAGQSFYIGQPGESFMIVKKQNV